MTILIFYQTYHLFLNAHIFFKLYSNLSFKNFKVRSIILNHYFSFFESLVYLLFTPPYLKRL